MSAFRPFTADSAARRVSIPLLMALMCLLELCVAKTAAAQGFLIEPGGPRPLPRVVFPHLPPRPHAPREIPYTIESEEIDAAINGSVAEVSVSQTFKNEGSATVETAFVFPIPYDGAIDSMTLLVDGKELPATLVDKDEARKQYEEIVRKAKDPALLEWIGDGLYRTSVFPIPAGETRTVSIRYTQLLRVDSGLVEFLFPMSAAKYTSKPIKKVAFTLSITGDAEIKNVYSPTYDVVVDRLGKTAVNASCTLENIVPSADFRLFFDQSADDVSAKIVSYRPDDADDGYFILLASPKIVDENAAPIPRTVVFCLDVSGSMSGGKIVQARDSLKFVLSRLRAEDKFNVVLFGTDVKSFKEELQPCTEEIRAEALAYADVVRASGSTNIEKALRRSFDLLNSDESDAPKYLVFLSDGEPTTGETNEMNLAALARDTNKLRARFFSFGLGYDVNARLLDRFVHDGRGRGEYVKPEENIEDRVAAFYNSIDAPVFANVEFTFALADAPDKKYVANRVYPADSVDLFAGEQLVMVGRYSEPGNVRINAKGKVRERDEEKTFEGSFTSKSSDATNAFVERLWALRRIGEIIDELDLNGKNDELLKELVDLSKKHGVMTPYTSFLARENTDLNALAANAAAADAAFSQIASSSSGMMGVMQRSAKQGMRGVSNLNGAQTQAIADSNAMMESAAVDSNADADAAVAVAEPAANSAPDSSSSVRAPRPVGGLGGGSIPGRLGGRGPRVLHARAAAPMIAPRIVQPKIAESVAEKIRSVAGKTFFLRDGRWLDSSIDDELEKNAKTVVLVRFSDEYFKLAEEKGQVFSQYLVFDEPVVLNFEGTIYRIETAEDEDETAQE